MECATREIGVGTRLREIDRELLAVRRDQKLFRHLGFGENIKVMQIVALQMERQECIVALGPTARDFTSDEGGERALVIAKGLARGMKLACGLLYCAAVGLSGDRGQRRPRRRIARAITEQTGQPASSDLGSVGAANSGWRPRVEYDSVRVLRSGHVG